MIRTINESSPPKKLSEYLDSNVNRPGFALRRRSVLTRSDQGVWGLVLCVVQAFPDPGQCPEVTQPHVYDRLMLLEDWFSLQQAQDFVADVQRGAITLGGVKLDRQSGPNWETELVPSSNIFMDRVGFVVQAQFENRQIAILQEPLISVTEPYYPDAASAVLDWLELAQYYGFGDGRNGHILFLLPEARALFASAVSDNGLLRLTMTGSEIGQLPLLVKGAYWEGKHIRHFEKRVLSEQVEFDVPNEVDRLEYVLIDMDGQIYDLQREAWGAHSSLTRKRVGTIDDALVQQVMDARESGEGDEVEFKPFIDPGEPSGPVRASSKFREVLRTIAAFANMRGGCIFFGIADDCALKGIQNELAKWGRSAVGDELLSRYKGAMTNKIRGELVGDARFRFSFVSVEGAIFAILAVSPFDQAAVGLRDDGLCYVRRGASNRYLSPHEWATVFGPRLGDQAY